MVEGEPDRTPGVVSPLATTPGSTGNLWEYFRLKIQSSLGTVYTTVLQLFTMLESTRTSENNPTNLGGKEGRTENRRRLKRGSVLVWMLRNGLGSMVVPARVVNYPAIIAQFFIAPHKPHHLIKVPIHWWGFILGSYTL